MSTLVIDARTFLQPARLPPVAYKPAHGGYPGLVTLGRWQPQRGVVVRTFPAQPQPGYRG